MALGRGLGELLGEIETAYENSNEITNHDILDLNIDSIKPNPYQPRKIFNEEKLQELSDSIVQHGLLQPIVVTKDDEDSYIVVAGERRLRASKLANLDKIKAIVLDIDKKQLRELALVENIQRDDLNIIEIAYSYAGLINDFDITHDELAKLVSKSRSSITNILRLLTLSSYTQKMLGASKITTGHAKLLIGLSEDKQKLIVDSIIGQKLSVRETEQLVKKLKQADDNTKADVVADTKSKLDLTKFDTIKTKLKDINLDVKVDKNYFKIKINSDEDIEKILKYFAE